MPAEPTSSRRWRPAWAHTGRARAHRLRLPDLRLSEGQRRDAIFRSTQRWQHPSPDSGVVADIQRLLGADIQMVPTSSGRHTELVVRASGRAHCAWVDEAVPVAGRAAERSTPSVAGQAGIVQGGVDLTSVVEWRMDGRGRVRWLRHGASVGSPQHQMLPARRRLRPARRSARYLMAPEDLTARRGIVRGSTCRLRRRPAMPATRDPHRRRAPSLRNAEHERSPAADPAVPAPCARWSRPTAPPAAGPGAHRAPLLTFHNVHWCPESCKARLIAEGTFEEPEPDDLT